MICRNVIAGLLLAAAIVVMAGCSEPPVPSEVQLALRQEQDLWRAGAPVYAPQEYQQYLDALSAGRELLVRERGRLTWFQDYAPVAMAFRQVLAQGEQVGQQVQAKRETEKEAVAVRLGQVEARVRVLRELAGQVKDRRLSMRHMVQAEVLLEEAQRFSRAGKGKEALARAEQAAAELEGLTRTVRALVARYADRQQISRWRRLAEEGVAQSKRSGGFVIVVSKLDRELTLYKSGTAVRTYPAGMGFNFLSDKLVSGDRATPEGSYQVIKKLPASKFYRALLINYPNAEDQKRFQQAKRENRIPRDANIGGLIEIHGGGKDGLTNGCVALENHHMQELFGMVEVGTPVIIVGALEQDNVVSSFLKQVN